MGVGDIVPGPLADLQAPARVEGEPEGGLLVADLRERQAGEVQRAELVVPPDHLGCSELRFGRGQDPRSITISSRSDSKSELNRTRVRESRGRTALDRLRFVELHHLLRGQVVEGHGRLPVGPEVAPRGLRNVYGMQKGSVIVPSEYMRSVKRHARPRRAKGPAGDKAGAGVRARQRAS